MALNYDDIRQILAILRDSDVEHLELRIGDVSLRADKTGRGAPPSGPVRSAGTGVPRDADDGGRGGHVDQRTPQPVRAEPSTSAPTTGGTDPDLVTVTAPTVGTFYRASGPDAEPYVAEGIAVSPESTVGLIEVMKVFTSVNAGAVGIVDEVLVENGAFVEYGQALMTVRVTPSGADPSGPP